VLGVVELNVMAKHSLTQELLMPHLHETAKIGLIFAVRPILPGRLSNFCKHPTDGQHIAQKWMER